MVRTILTSNASTTHRARRWLFHPRYRDALFWILNTCFWGLLGICGMMATEAFRSTLPNSNAFLVLRMATGIIIGGLLRWLYRRPSWPRAHQPSAWILGLVACVAAIFLEVLCCWKLYPLISPLSLQGLLKLQMTRLFMVSIWTMCYFAVHLIEEIYLLEIKELRAREAHLQSEMRRLQAHMNPHFLFNALNAILATKHNPEGVEDVTQALADFLRFSLQDSRPLEPLSRELDALEKYLVVQECRFGPNLICRLECDTLARDALVPPMLVQPILENAFNYGAKCGSLPLRVRVSARSLGPRLRISVANTGHWIPPDPTKSLDTGLNGLKRRLELLFADQASIQTSEENGWVEVVIDIPVPPSP